MQYKNIHCKVNWQGIQITSLIEYQSYIVTIYLKNQATLWQYSKINWIPDESIRL